MNWPVTLKVLAIAWLVVRYAATFTFIGAAIIFFVRVVRAVTRFVDRNEEVVKRLLPALAENARMYAEQTTEILEILRGRIDDHDIDIAVIQNELGLPMKPPEPKVRRRRPRRPGDGERRK